ncbi:hypothetical protein ACTMTJ_20725 [Phytohabitans sp. LJ34]|uniref:hypothetical protein n=1 Tax=Phytohabitans sp. LJ34 TaxID=3452217 RepID=UPI003F899F6D
MSVTGIIRSTRGVAVLLALALAAGGVYLWQGRADAAAQAPKFSPVQLSDAVLFNEGPAAPYLESLGRGRIPWTQTLREGQKAIHESIAKDNEFAANLQSGDPVKVRGALRDLSATARDALNQRWGAGVVDEAVKRLFGIYDERFVDTLRQNKLRFNFQKPCCLENYVDIISSSVLTAFLQEVWQPSGLALEAAQLVQDTMIRDVTMDLRA